MNIDLIAVFGIGAMTLATPCVLPLLPIYLGMLLGEGLEVARDGRGRWRLLTATAAFAVGFTMVFTLLGLGASALGSVLQDYRQELMLVGAVVIVLFGLKFLGLLRIPWLDREVRIPQLRTGRRLIDATLFGVVFALGWTPCVGPILGSVLTYTASRTADPLTGALYLSVYGLGVASPLLVISLFADRLVPLLGRLNKKLPILEKVIGTALVLLGLGLAFSAVSHAGWLLDSSEPTIAILGATDQGSAAPVGEPSKRPRVVEFFRPGCSACELARERVATLQEDCDEHHIEILMVDAEAPANRELARRFSLSVVPTFVLLGVDGQERGRLVGAPALTDLRVAAASLMEESCAGSEGQDLDDLDELLGDEEEGCTADEDQPLDTNEDCAS